MRAGAALKAEAPAMQATRIDACTPIVPLIPHQAVDVLEAVHTVQTTQKKSQHQSSHPHIVNDTNDQRNLRQFNAADRLGNALGALSFKSSLFTQIFFFI
jgi:hypothetical protein